MAKDPAFLFYSSDFLTGVLTMDFEDRGKYVTLLCLMHQQGRMNEETIRFIVGSFSDKLKSKFEVDEHGLFYSKRLEVEIEKRNNFTASRRANGSKGGRPIDITVKKKNHKVNRKVKHMDNHMENENINEIIIIIKEVISYLNLKCSKNFKTSEVNAKLIRARVAEGYKLEDFKKVIDGRYEKWFQDQDMQQYLRPITLFGSKFESYLNDQVPVKKEANTIPFRNDK